MEHLSQGSHLSSREQLWGCTKEWGQDVCGAGCVPQGASTLVDVLRLMPQYAQGARLDLRSVSREHSGFQLNEQIQHNKKQRGERAAWAAEKERTEEGINIPAPSSPAPARPLVPRHFLSTYTHARAEEGQGHCYASPATQRGVQSSSH